MTLENTHNDMASIVVIFDTNMIRSKLNEENPLNFTVSKGLTELINDKQASNALYIKLFVSEITVKELIEQQFEYYEKKYNKKPERETKEEIKVKIYSFFKKHYIKIIDFNSVSFKKIVDRAIKKEPPFNKKGKKKDAGFKDAVIWESILIADNELYKNRPAKFIIVTCDNDFEPEILTKEFQNDYYRKQINIQFIKDWQLLKKELQNLFFELITNANVYEPDLINFINKHCQNNVEIINSRSRMQYIRKCCLVKITSKINIENKEAKFISYYDYKNKKLIDKFKIINIG